MSPSRTAFTAKCSLQVQREQSKGFFDSINSYRRSRNVHELVWSDSLYTYCVMHNINMHGSRVKSSDFKFGQGYNENTAHAASGSRSQILDLWRSKDQERNNILFDGVNYSAVAILGDDTESYATQIFTTDRPQKNEKVRSMRSAKSCASCLNGNKIRSHRSSSRTFRTTTVASTNLRSRGGMSRRGGQSTRPTPRTGRSAAHTGAISSRPVVERHSSARVGGVGPVTQAVKNLGENLGQSLKIGGQSLISGLKSIGDTLGTSPPRETHKSHRQNNRARSHSQPSRRSPNGHTRSTFGPSTSMRNMNSTTGGALTNIRNGGGGDNSASNCPICNMQMTLRSTFCDICTSKIR